MKKLLLLLLLTSAYNIAHAQDSIQVRMNKFSFSANDTIQFSCSIPEFSKLGLAAVTLNVWIQEVNKQHTWKFRYPVLNGECEGSLAIGDSIKPGKYAVNFILQPGLFKMNGAIATKFGEKSINYLMMVKDKKTYLASADLKDNNTFTLKNLLFEDQAFFVFAPTKKYRNGDLVINISTPLDSAFTPLATFSQVIDVKPELYTGTDTKPTPAYTFDFKKTYDNTTLPEVVVYSKGKKKVEQYEEAYATGLFKGGDARTFDGLQSDEIANSIDIETFLMTHVAGLRKTTNEEGMATMVWRNSPVTVYIDEFRLEEGESIFVLPSDVAMIKVFSPPAMLTGGNGAGGAVAIYTKRGDFNDNQRRKFRFLVKGYTALDSTWK